MKINELVENASDLLGLNFKGFFAEPDAPDAPDAPKSPDSPGSANNPTSTYTPSKGVQSDGKPLAFDAGAIKSSNGSIDPKTIGAYLKSKGLDKNQVAGLLVSIKWESRFKPGAYVKSDNHQGPSGGFFGFHDPKFDGRGNFSDMVKFCGGLDKWQTNWQGQLDFALSRGVGAAYKSKHFSTPGDAASWWVINYEKPADTQGQAVARAKDAAQYAYA